MPFTAVKPIAVKPIVESSSEPAKPPRRRRAVLAAIVASVVTLVSAEALSFVILWASEGRLLASRTLASERAQLAAETTEPSEAAAAPVAPAEVGATPRPVPVWKDLLQDPAHARRVIHPYLGYVYDPALDRSPDRQRAGFPPIGTDGFYAPVVEVPGNDPAVEVAVFGGSMAMAMVLDAGEALARELAAARSLHGRRLVVRCYALGGYKQPQQLLALAHLLVLGDPPEIAVNLDGLNEVALPWSENRPRGVHPLFPRSWDALVRETTNPAALAAAGRVAHLRERRAQLATTFSGPLVGRSATGNLLWRALDRRLAGELAAANVRLSQLPSGPPSFAASGPPAPFAATDDELFPALVRAWQASSRAMAGLASGGGFRYYHFLQPNQFDPGAKPMGGAERARAADPASSFSGPVRLAYPLLSRAGEELHQQGVAFFDLRRVFATVEAPLYVDQCCHVSREGSVRLAEAIGRAVRADLDAVAGGAAATAGSSH